MFNMAISNRKDKKGEGMTFKSMHKEAVTNNDFGHYQVECPIFFRKQKKSFSATLSYEETHESEEEDEFTNAFISKMTEDDSITDNKELEVEKENFPSYE